MMNEFMTTITNVVMGPQFFPSFVGALVAIALILLVALVLKVSKGSFSLLFGKLYETMFEFFEDIL